MKKFLPFIFIVILLGCSRRGIETSTIEVINLKCNYLSNPVGIDDCSPLFSWQLQDAVRGQVQTAFRIRVASSESKLEKGEGDIWDSGKTNSDQNVGIKFNGIPLESGNRYYWNVQVWDKDGKISQSHENAFYETGLLKDDDWKAKWISAPTLFDWSIIDRTYNDVD